MDVKILVLVCFFGPGASTRPRDRVCDNERQMQTPTACSNLEYIREVEKKIDTGISHLVKRLDRMMSETQKNFSSTRTQLQQRGADIAALQRQVAGRAAANVTRLEQRLRLAEGQLREDEANLTRLEAETRDALGDTRTLLHVHKREFSELSALTRELRGSVMARLNSTDAKLGAAVKTIRDNREALSAELRKQKSCVSRFVNEAQINFRMVKKQLETGRTAGNKQQNEIEMLRRNTTALQRRLTQAEVKADDKVAFSATVVSSPHVFTGPATAESGNKLVFNKVFTNVGNAYDKKTGIFSAPVSGVYYFSFMTFGYNSHTSGAILVKNGIYQVSTWEFKGQDVSDTTSNSVILQLHATETVNIILWKDGMIHTAVFSGFLLFRTP